MSVPDWEESERQALLSEQVLRETACPVCNTQYFVGQDRWSDHGFAVCPNGHGADIQWFIATESKCYLCSHYERDSGDASVGLQGYHLCLKKYGNINGWPFIAGCKGFLRKPASMFYQKISGLSEHEWWYFERYRERLSDVNAYLAEYDRCAAMRKAKEATRKAP